MEESIDCEVVSDANVAIEIARRANEILSQNDDGTFELTRLAGWIAVPIESASHLSSRHVERLVTAFCSHHQVYAVALERLKQIPSVLRIRPSEVGLRSFNRACAHFNYSLCADDFSALVLCSTADFLVAAGSLQFVRAATGGDAATAFSSFEGFARKMGPMQRTLHSVLASLRDSFPSARCGESVHFPT